MDIFWILDPDPDPHNKRCGSATLVLNLDLCKLKATGCSALIMDLFFGLGAYFGGLVSRFLGIFQ